MALIGFAIAFGIVGVWVYRGIHKNPAGWQSGSCFYGSLLAFYFLPMTFSIKDDLHIEDSDAIYATVAVAINIAIVLLGWLPARRAAHIVLGNLLSPEVVNSPFTVTFKARGKFTPNLRVTPDELRVDVRPNMDDSNTKAVHPLADVRAVTVRTEARDGTYPVPGANGKRVNRFIEERGRAVVAGG